VVRGSSYVGLAAERFPEAVRVLFPDSQALLAALKQGRVQAIFQSEAFMEKILAEAPALSISHRLLYLPGHDDRFACVLPWTSVHFWKWLNTTLEALDASPDSGGLWRKYDRNRY
jgi:ABC-type amino acid transport substrate-binding protein